MCEAERPENRIHERRNCEIIQINFRNSVKRKANGGKQWTSLTSREHNLKCFHYADDGRGGNVEVLDFITHYIEGHGHLLRIKRSHVISA